MSRSVQPLRREKTIRLALAAIGALILGFGCNERSVTTPADRPAGSVARLDQAPLAAFMWLAPLGTGTADPSMFDPTASPTIEICAWSGAACSGAPIATFATTPATGIGPIVVNTAVGDYEASWNLLNAALTTRKIYRIRVLQGTVEVGAISVDVVRGRWALTRSDGALAPLVSANELPIRFEPGLASMLIGAGGGTISAPGSGASAVVLPGTFTTATTIRFGDTPFPASWFLPLFQSAHRVVVSLSSLGTSGGIRFNVPMGALANSSDAAYLRVRIAGAPQDYWAAIDATPGSVASVTVPFDGLAEIVSLLQLSTLDMVMWLEDYPVSAPPVLARGAGKTHRTAMSPTTSSNGCQPSIAPLVYYAACGQTLLRDASQLDGQPAGNKPTIVLVHGWMPWEAWWVQYYADQGISCVLVRFESCTVPGTPKTGRNLPGEAYFQTLDSALRHDLPGASVLEFDYESYNHVEDNASGLAYQLTAEFGRNGGKGSVLVGHSMGGLVARRAVQLIETQNINPADTIVRGVIALASPHLGTPLPRLLLAKAFVFGVPSSGGQDLINGVPYRGEKTPLYIYGGIFNGNPPHLKYNVPSSILCLNDPTKTSCDPPQGIGNDGFVPLSSALPIQTQLPSVAQRILVGYDHDAMALNRGVDPLGLYGRIFRDVCRLLECVHIVSRAIAVTVGETQSVSATLAGLPSGTAISWRTLHPTISVVGGSASAPNSNRPVRRSRFPSRDGRADGQCRRGHGSSHCSRGAAAPATAPPTAATARPNQRRPRGYL